MADIKTEKKTAQDLGQYVTFLIENDLFGIDVMNVQEVVEVKSITHVPKTQPFMKGVIDLRGIVVSLVDMRILFDLEERPGRELTVIIIVELYDRLVGLIVDSVQDVMNLTATDVQDTPHFAVNINRDSVTGVARANGKLIIILDSGKLLSREEIEGIDTATA